MHLLANGYFRVQLRRCFLKKGLQRLPLMQDNAFSACAASGIHIQHKPRVIQFGGVRVNVPKRAR